MKGLSWKISLFYGSRSVVWIIIGFGIVLRFSQYLYNRSLWLDEAFLALNIINRSFLELLQPLSHAQGAPIGFLMIEKLLINAFGNSEYVLRLFPFLCGVTSLFLFYRVAAYYLKTKALIIALALFAISDRLIYYSSEVKQYSSDVAIVLLLYSVTIYIQSKKLTPSRIVLLGVIGAITIWFSHPAVFILAGVGISLILFCLHRKEWSRIGRISIVYLFWISSFVACYFVSLRNLIYNKHLLDQWSGSFMPFPPTSLSDIKWFLDTFFRIFKNPVGLPLSGVAGLTFLVGCISIGVEKKRDFFILISPLPFILVASALYKYPLSGRLLLFITPFALLFIAEGTEQIRNKVSYNSTIIRIIIGVVFIVLLFLYPLFSADYHPIIPRKNEEIRPIISYIREHWQDGDLLYLYYSSGAAFEYYSKKYGFKKSDYIIGISSRRDWTNYIKDLDKLRGNKRVWIVFSHVCYWHGVDEERLFLHHLDSIGTRLDSFRATGAAVYLYDLSKLRAK